MIWVPIILSVLSMVLLIVIDAGIVLDLTALVALMILPGAALASWLVPQGRAALAPRILVATGLGLTLAVLGGIVLDRTPVGLRSTPILLALVGLAYLVALWRRDRATWVRRMPRLMSVPQASLLALALVLATTAFGVSRWGLGAGPVELTQLWLIRAPDGTLQAGVTNDGRSPATYRLVLSSAQAEVLAWPDFILQPGGTWRQAVPQTVIPATPLRATLYRSDQPDTPFREVLMSDPKAGG